MLTRMVEDEDDFTGRWKGRARWGAKETDKERGYLGRRVGTMHRRWEWGRRWKGWSGGRRRERKEGRGKGRTLGTLILRRG